MFVDIKDFKSAIAVENILMPYKKGRLSSDKKSRLPKEKITPQVCMEILKSTNYARNIKDMLQCIAELPAGEQAQFKDVVLATFSNREQPNKQPHNVVLLGKKLAVASGYEEEFAEVQKLKDGDFLFSAPKLDKALVYLDNSFSNVDFSAYDKVLFVSDEKIEFNENVKFPKILEMPNSLDVSFLFYDKDGDLAGGNLSGVQSIFFKEGAKVNFSSVKIFPENLDVSMCDEVNFSKSSLLRLVNLRFKEGAKVNFSSAKSLPANLDVSMCSDVNLSKCKLLWMGNLRFHEGAKVDFSSAKSLPANLDVSMCSEVNLTDCDLGAVKKLVFKNRQQMEDSCAELPDDWTGKLVFADEQTEPPALGLAMAAKTLGGRS